MPPARMPNIDRETERQLAAALYNEVWRLMETPNRRPEQDVEMLHAAHASRYHWGRIGRPVNLARGEWLCARVYSVLGRGEPAVWHARRCLEVLTEFGGGEDWDLAAACEGLARAYAVAGDLESSKSWIEKSREAIGQIVDADDRSPIETDLESIG
jgi:hypothetical protein